MTLRLGGVRLGLALLLQPMLFELLGVQRLFRIRLLLVLRPAFATIRTIAPVGAAAPAAATATPPAAGLFAILPRLNVAVWRAGVGSLLRGFLRRTLLLRRTPRALIGSALALRALGGLAFGLRILALLLGFALRAILPRLRLLRRTLIPALLLLDALLIPSRVARLIASALAALLVIALGVTVATRPAIASTTAFGAAVIVPVT